MRNANPTYRLFVDGNLVLNAQGEEGFGLPKDLKSGHIRMLRKGCGITPDHKPFIDDSPADEDTPINNGAKVEFKSEVVA